MRPLLLYFSILSFDILVKEVILCSSVFVWVPYGPPANNPIPFILSEWIIAWIAVIKDPLEKPDIVNVWASAPKLGNLKFVFYFKKNEAKFSFVKRFLHFPVFVFGQFPYEFGAAEASSLGQSTVSNFTVGLFQPRLKNLTQPAFNIESFNLLQLQF